MEIRSQIVSSDGIKYEVEYSDIDSFDNLPKELCKQSYGVCFVGDKLVIGFGGKKKDWGLIGGSIEIGETPLEALHREIKEESNMKILSAKPIGYQKVTNTSNNKQFFQLRYVCEVEPYGPFVSDPDGGITEIKLIDPKDYKKYFDWGEIGERIIRRSLQTKSQS